MSVSATTRAVLLGAFALAVAACVPVTPPPPAPAEPAAGLAPTTTTVAPATTTTTTDPNLVATTTTTTVAPTTTTTTTVAPITTTTTTTTVAPTTTTVAPTTTTAPAPPACGATTSGAGTQGAASGDSVVALVRQHGRLRVERHSASSRADAKTLARHLRARSDVVAADVDQPVHAFDTPGPDPYRPQQWALNRIAFESTWTATPGSNGAGVTVAVIDTGVRATLPDLNDGRVLAGCDFVDPNGGDGSHDQNGHGSFVAGVIGAENQNSQGITGAAPGVHLLPVRVLDASGGGSYATVEEGITWATDHGANVINMSLGGTSQSATLQQAIQYAVDHGVTVVMAAGNCAQGGSACNNSVNPTMYPAAYSSSIPGAIAVGATDSSDAIANFSSHGTYVDVAAPGVGIVSTWPPDIAPYASYVSGDGTSFSSPYVAAAVAIEHAVCPADTPAQLRTRLEATAQDLGTAGRDDFFGAGLIRPDLAVAAC